MDFGREAGFGGGNVVHVLAGSQSNGGVENWGSGDQAIWATEDDYGAWSRENSVDTNPSYDGRQSQSRSESDHLSKKSRISIPGDSRSKAIGKMFFKTKLCCKFRAGTCPYVTNCNFAHSIEELRRPPPNWQEIVAAHDEDRGVSLEPREEFQIPAVASAIYVAENQRSYKGRLCKRFFTEEGCSYGENCSFLHDEQSKTRESVAISLGPGSGGSYGANVNANANANANAATVKPANWKTRICNKWEMTGYCPFGTKCHFAHGVEELHRYGGGLLDEGEAADLMSNVKQQQQSGVPVAGDNSVVGSSHQDGYHSGGVLPSQRLIQRTTVDPPPRKWKGPNKISLIYGDWIDDLE